MKNNQIQFSVNHEEKIIDISSIKYFFKPGEFIEFRGKLSEFKKSTINLIILNLKKNYSDYNFWWIEHGECILKKWDSNDIKDMIAIFNENNMYHKLFFVDNNLGESKYKNLLNYKSIPFLLGFTSHKSFHIEHRKFNKKFISLNRIPKPHRREIFKFLKDNYFNDSYLSFAPNHEEDTDRLVFDEVERISHGNMLHAWTSEYQKYSFCNIVTESMWISGPIHITEKIDKCFSAGQPFVLVTGSGYLKKLKELGFKTFDKWWDESYDDEYDYYKRIEKIKNTISKIANYSLIECEKLYQEMIPILRHNQDLCKKFRNNMIYQSYNWPHESIKIITKKDVI